MELSSITLLSPVTQQLLPFSNDVFTHAEGCIFPTSVSKIQGFIYIEHLKSDFSIISEWSRRNLVAFSASSAQFLHCQLDTTFQTAILFPSITCNCPSLLQLTCLVCPSLIIITLAKSTSSRLESFISASSFLPDAN